MDHDIRLVAKIYRAIREFEGSALDEDKCERIAQLINNSDFPVQIEALVEQHADRIQAMRAEDFVESLRAEVEQRIRRSGEDIELDDALERMH